MICDRNRLVELKLYIFFIIVSLMLQCVLQRTQSEMVVLEFWAVFIYDFIHSLDVFIGWTNVCMYGSVNRANMRE